MPWWIRHPTNHMTDHSNPNSCRKKNLRQRPHHHFPPINCPSSTTHHSSQWPLSPPPRGHCSAPCHDPPQSLPFALFPPRPPSVRANLPELSTAPSRTAEVELVIACQRFLISASIRAREARIATWSFSTSWLVGLPRIGKDLKDATIGNEKEAG